MKKMKVRSARLSRRCLSPQRLYTIISFLVFFTILVKLLRNQETFSSEIKRLKSDLQNESPNVGDLALRKISKLEYHHASQEQDVSYDQEDLDLLVDLSLNHTVDIIYKEFIKIADKNEVLELLKNHNNVPIEDWLSFEGTILPKISQTCAIYPEVSRVKFSNKLWQIENTTRGLFYLYGAYYDDRDVFKNPAVRITGMKNSYDTEKSLNYTCQLWFANYQQPVISQVTTINLMWVKQWGVQKDYNLLPYMLTCEIPTGYKKLIPRSVSIVERPCNMATNNLKVIYNDRKPVKDNIGVCVKALSFMDKKQGIKLIEWIEALRLMGASVVHMYYYESHSFTKSILQHYISRGKVTLNEMTFPKDLPVLEGIITKSLRKRGLQKRYNEVLVYTDCLLRHMHDHSYILLLDTDELIVGKNQTSWQKIIRNENTKLLSKTGQKKVSYCAINSYFTEKVTRYSDVPSYMTMLQRTTRTQNYTRPGQYVKCFHDTQQAIILHNHFPMKCIKACNSVTFNTTVAQMHHYRHTCSAGLEKVCFALYWNHTVEDLNLHSYKKELIFQVQQTMKDITKSRKGVVL